MLITKLELPIDQLEFLQQSNLIEGEPDHGVAIRDAVEAWLTIRDLKEIRLDHVLACHAALMRTRKTVPKKAKGAWTTVPTGIYAGGVCIRQNPPPSEVPALMLAWVEQIDRSIFAQPGFPDPEEKDEVARGYHVSFEEIHPFQDGNGRVGRILYEWHRLRLGLPIHVIREEEKRDYYAWFRKKP